MKLRILHFLIAIDQLVYVILTLGKGYPDETLSSAAWRLEQGGHFMGRFWRPAIDFLARPFERDHCQKAYDSEKRRNHVHQSMRP